MRRFGVPSSEFDGFMPENGAYLTGCPAKDNAKTPALRYRTAARRPPPKRQQAECSIPRRLLGTKRPEKMATGKEQTEFTPSCLKGCTPPAPRSRSVRALRRTTAPYGLLNPLKNILPDRKSTRL